MTKRIRLSHLQVTQMYNFLTYNRASYASKTLEDIHAEVNIELSLTTPLSTVRKALSDLGISYKNTRVRNITDERVVELEEKLTRLAQAMYDIVAEHCPPSSAKLAPLLDIINGVIDD